MTDASRPIVLLDVEASGGKPLCYPVEIAWGVRGSGVVESHLLKPAPDWTADADRWQWHAEQKHGLSHARLVQEGEDLVRVAKRMNEALAGADVYADDDQDARWIRRLFAETGVPQSFAVRPFGELYHRLGATQVVEEAKAVARARSPGTHRAAGDVRHHLAFIAALEELAGTRRLKPPAEGPYIPHAKVLRQLHHRSRTDVGIGVLWERAIELEKDIGQPDAAPPSEKKTTYLELVGLLERVQGKFRDAARLNGTEEQKRREAGRCKEGGPGAAKDAGEAR